MFLTKEMVLVLGKYNLTVTKFTYCNIYVLINILNIQ